MEKTDLRATVYITEDMAQRLDRIKKEVYYNKSKAEMLRDLLAIGISEFEKENNIGG